MSGINNVLRGEYGDILRNIFAWFLPTVDGDATGICNNQFNASYTSAKGDLCYLTSSSTWAKTDANTLLLYNGFLGIALEVKASGDPLLVALPNSFVYLSTWSWTVGLPIYMSETAGGLTQTAPVTADSATRVIGHAVATNKIWFAPSNDYTVHV